MHARVPVDGIRLLRARPLRPLPLHVLALRVEDLRVDLALAAPMRRPNHPSLFPESPERVMKMFVVLNPPGPCLNHKETPQIWPLTLD